MISNNERREVARNLREIEERTLLDVTDGELLDLLAEAVGLDGYEGEHFEGGLLSSTGRLPRATASSGPSTEGRPRAARSAAIR